MLAVLTCFPVAAGAQDGSAIADALQPALNISKAPGTSLAVMEHGTITIERGFGVRNVGTQAPVDPHTRFEIGSITKQFTAAAILQLKERGKLALTDPLGKYVPQYAAARAVTIEQLLWQVSGIPNYTDVPNFDRIAVSRAGSLAGVLALIRNKPLEFAPGTKWAYSNTNYYLLGRVVERASGMPWAQYVRTHIFVPAGMNEATFMEDERSAADMATGYELKNNKLVASPPFGGWADSAGAIVCTAADLLKWDRALFGGKIVSAADLRLMTQAARLRNGEATEYGFGWVVSKHDGTPEFSHAGGTFGFAAENEVYPKLDEAIVVLQNNSAAPPDIVAGSVFRVLNPQLVKDESRSAAGEDPAITAKAKATLRLLLNGNPDRSQLDAAMNKALTPQVLSAADEQIKAYGAPQTWVYRGKSVTAQGTTYLWLVTFSSGVKLKIEMALDPDGKIGGYNLLPQ
jgi:CubicO group peptidase (beta-lactamase class C family)